jgi:ABC-type multidrug transport system fused ATPase/permease subunit
MTVPSLGKFLVPATLAAGAVFSVLTTPLALFGLEPITIETKGTEVFKGSLKDIAAPYLGFAGALSLGVGVTSLALAGWRQSSRQSGKLEQQVSGMQSRLKEKEGQLQGLLLSDKNLETTGLQFFLEDEESIQAIPAEVTYQAQTAAQNSVVAQPIVQTAAQVAQPIVVSSAAIAPSRTTLSTKTTVQAAVSPLHAAQAFLSFSRTGTSASAVTPAWTQVTPASSENAVAQIGELQTQLQQIMAQIETLQSNTWVKSQSALNQRATVEPMISSIPQVKQRQVEPQRVMQIVAS